jgi:hypothetical protein
MSAAIAIVRGWAESCLAAWDQFWFTPRLPHTLGVIRICTGAMLLYMHVVLASQLTSFLGEHAWINNRLAGDLHNGTFVEADLARSYLWLISSPFLLWCHQWLAIVVTLAFTVGLMTRITAPAAWFLQLMYLHRLTGALFGLDQIATYSAMYLMLSPCGSCYSVDAWLRRKYGRRRRSSRWLKFLLPADGPSVAANVATRLFQIHLCVIYLFGGLAKARGDAWWDGLAVWFAVGNYEYQSVDMTWLASFPRLFSTLTHITVFWEVFYCALVWPRLTRPVVLLLAVAVHGGIAMFMGMITFGTMMIVANMIFLEPDWIRKLLHRRKAAEPAVREPDDEEGLGGINDAALAAINAEDMAELDQEGFHVPEEDDLSCEDASAPSSASRDDLAAAAEAGDTSPGASGDGEEQIRWAQEKIRRREAALAEREQKYRERVERLKAREAKIKEVVAKRRAKIEEKGKADSQ